MDFSEVERVIYLGPQASFCEMAKDYFTNKFNINTYAEYLPTIRQVVDYIDNNPNTLGILPVENSLEGTVRETLDNLINTKNPNIKILSEIIMPVNYCLLARTTELYSITGVISSPQILAQCQNFVENELPRNLNLIDASGTAEAARMLSNYNLTYASIGSEKTAEVYNLNILKSNINDDKSNQTRFIMIGDFETELTTSDKSSIAFTTENKPGALLKILNIFMENEINLSYISSRPAKEPFGEYVFIVNFDGHYKNKNIISTINQVREHTTFFRFLGSYNKSKHAIETF